MALNAADADELVALRAARTALMSGGAVAKVQSGGRLVEYVPAKAGDLQARIDALEAAALTPSGAVRRRGALRIFVS